MKIIYLISTRGHGRGGHFYDLKVIAKAVNQENDIKIINVGLNNSPIIDELKKNGIQVFNIFFNGINFLNSIIKVYSIVKQSKGSVLHCFDNESLSFARLVGPVLNMPIILSKCGGPNPTGYFPICSNLIVMSQENFDYFQSNKKYQKSQIHCIPNRAEKIISDKLAVSKIKKITKNSTVFLRISRITEHYKTSLHQFISLGNEMIKRNFDVVFIIVGVVQSKALLISLKEKVLNKSRILFFTNDFYTLNASRVIESSDFIVGTGRGIMEAASLDKVLLTPIEGGRFPVLIDENNFSELFQTNFSPRNRVANFNEDNNLHKIIDVVNNTKRKEELRKFVRQVYDENFNINMAVVKYMELYKGAKKGNLIKPLNFIYGLLSTIKSFYLLRNSYKE